MEESIPVDAKVVQEAFSTPVYANATPSNSQSRKRQVGEPHVQDSRIRR